MWQTNSLLERYRVSDNPLRSERRVELAALVLTLVLILQLLYSAIILSMSSIPQAILPSADTLQVNELQRGGVVSAELSSELRARPVFWPSRRPVIEMPAEALENNAMPARKNDLSQVKLLGVIGSGDSAVIIALVKGHKRRILLGDKVVGWTLDSIAPSQAVFVESGRSQILALAHTAVISESKPANASNGAK